MLSRQISLTGSITQAPVSSRAFRAASRSTASFARSPTSWRTLVREGYTARQTGVSSKPGAALRPEELEQKAKEELARRYEEARRWREAKQAHQERCSPGRH